MTSKNKIRLDIRTNVLYNGCVIYSKGQDVECIRTITH